MIKRLIPRDMPYDDQYFESEFASENALGRLDAGDYGYGESGSLFELEEDLELLGFGRSEVWLGEVNRKSPKYIKWVQQSLNSILGTQLAVDGIFGRQTRNVVRNFQHRRGLAVDGSVGAHTEAKLVDAGASPPPGAKVTGQISAPVPQPAVRTRPALNDVARRGIRLLQDQQRIGQVLSSHQTQRLGCLLLRMLWRNVDDRYITAQSVLTYFNQPKPAPGFTWPRVRTTLTNPDLFGPTVSDKNFLRKLELLDMTIIDGRHKINQLFAQHGIAVSMGVQWLRKWMADRQKEHLSIYRCYRG